MPYGASYLYSLPTDGAMWGTRRCGASTKHFCGKKIGGPEGFKRLYSYLAYFKKISLTENGTLEIPAPQWRKQSQNFRKIACKARRRCALDASSICRHHFRQSLQFPRNVAIDCPKQVLFWIIFEWGKFIRWYSNSTLTPPSRTSTVNHNAIRYKTDFRGPFKMGYIS